MNNLAHIDAPRAVRRAVGNRGHSHAQSPAGKQLAALRKAWREASEAVRQHFLTEVTEKV